MPLGGRLAASCATPASGSSPPTGAPPGRSGPDNAMRPSPWAASRRRCRGRRTCGRDLGSRRPRRREAQRERDPGLRLWTLGSGGAPACSQGREPLVAGMDSVQLQSPRGAAEPAEPPARRSRWSAATIPAPLWGFGQVGVAGTLPGAGAPGYIPGLLWSPGRMPRTGTLLVAGTDAIPFQSPGGGRSSGASGAAGMRKSRSDGDAKSSRPSGALGSLRRFGRSRGWRPWLHSWAPLEPGEVALGPARFWLRQEPSGGCRAPRRREAQ